MGHGSSSHGEVRDYLKHVNTDIIPSADLKYQLGTSSRQFLSVFADSINAQVVTGVSSAVIGSSLIVTDSMQSAFLIASDNGASKTVIVGSGVYTTGIGNTDGTVVVDLSSSQLDSFRTIRSINEATAANIYLYDIDTYLLANEIFGNVIFSGGEKELSFCKIFFRRIFLSSGTNINLFSRRRSSIFSATIKNSLYIFNCFSNSSSSSSSSGNK